MIRFAVVYPEPNFHVINVLSMIAIHDFGIIFYGYLRKYILSQKYKDMYSKVKFNNHTST